MVKHMACALFMAASIVSFHCSAAQAAAEGPEAVVRGFSEKYIAADGRMDLSRFAELDKAFTDKIAAMKAKAAKENPELGGLDFDPVIWGQEFPAAITVLRPVLSGDAALVTVGKSWPEEKEPSSFICASLRKKAGAWRIVDLVDPELFEKKGCGSFRPGAMFPALPE